MLLIGSFYVKDFRTKILITGHVIAILSILDKPFFLYTILLSFVKKYGTKANLIFKIKVHLVTMYIL